MIPNNLILVSSIKCSFCEASASNTIQIENLENHFKESHKIYNNFNFLVAIIIFGSGHCDAETSQFFQTLLKKTIEITNYVTKYADNNVVNIDDEDDNERNTELKQKLLSVLDSDSEDEDDEDITILPPTSVNSDVTEIDNAETETNRISLKSDACRAGLDSMYLCV